MKMQNRPFVRAVAAGALVVAAWGCHVTSGNDPNRPLVARVRASDASAARQLAAGFYNVENGAWRWTAAKFAVVLPVSDQAKTSGAILTLKLTFPAAQMAQLGSTTLSADVNGIALPTQTFSAAGNYTYSQQVPAAVLGGPTVSATFALSKSTPGSAQDRRELGAVFHEVRLITK